MDHPAPQTTLSIPSLLFFALVSFFAIRYFFFSSSPTPTTTGSRSPSSSAAVSADRVDQVAAVFPQLNRRDVEWDLLRNGGSVAATTERVLREGRLPVVCCVFLIYGSGSGRCGSRCKPSLFGFSSI